MDGLASYTHDDNKATHGRVLKIVESIETTYRADTGRPLNIFVDSSIPAGNSWEKGINSALLASTFMLAFLSPAYFRSQQCRRELETFLNRSGRRFLIPLIYSTVIRINREFHGDPLWGRVLRLQVVPIDQLRSEEQGSRDWVILIEKIANRIAVEGPLPAK